MARLLLIALAAALVAACSPGRTVESVQVLRALASPTPPPGVTRTETTFGPDTRPADLYIGPRPPRAALVVVPGAAEAGRRDPRLVRFAQDLAAARFLVFVPQLGADHPLRLSGSDADTIAAAVRHLAAESGAERVGVSALSYAVGPAVLAALREDTRDHVAFVLGVGGYHDITAGITALTTGFWRPAPDAAWQTMDVPINARWLFLEANASRLEAPDDALLEAIAVRRLRDPAAPINDLAAGLTPPGQAVLALMTNPDPDAVPGLISALPEPLRREIETLDLARRDLSPLRARLLLIHGRDDPMVPHSESLALAAAAPHGQARVYLVDGLRHVDLEGVGTWDAVTLAQATYHLLRERDRAPAPFHHSFTVPLVETAPPIQ